MIRLILSISVTWALYLILYELAFAPGVSQFDSLSEYHFIILAIIMIVLSHVAAPIGAWPFIIILIEICGVYLGLFIHIISIGISTFFIYIVAQKFGESRKPIFVQSIIKPINNTNIIEAAIYRTGLFIYPDFLNFMLVYSRVSRRVYFLSFILSAPFIYCLNIFVALGLGITGLETSLPWAVAVNVVGYGGIFIAAALYGWKVKISHKSKRLQ